MGYPKAMNLWIFCAKSKISLLPIGKRKLPGYTRPCLSIVLDCFAIFPQCLTCCLMLALSSNMVRIWIISRGHLSNTKSCNRSGPLNALKWFNFFFQRTKWSNTQCGISTGIHGGAVNEVTLVIIQTICNTIDRAFSNHDGMGVKTRLITWILSHLKLLQSLSLPPLGREHCINATQSGCKGDYNKFERMWIREGEGDELYSAIGSGDLEKNLSSPNGNQISCDLLVFSVDVLLLRYKRPVEAKHKAIIIN